MTEPLPDVWAGRDYPVLREATRIIDSGQLAQMHELAEATGLELADVGQALRALERRGLIEADRALAGITGATDVSGEAYLLTGLHPNGDDAVSKLVDALRQAADQQADPEEKSRLRKLADGVGGVSRDVLAGVLAAVITASTGVGPSG